MKKTKIGAIRKSEVVRRYSTHFMTKNSLDDFHIFNNTLSTISQVHFAKTNIRSAVNVTSVLTSGRVLKY